MDHYQVLKQETLSKLSEQLTSTGHLCVLGEGKGSQWEFREKERKEISLKDLEKLIWKLLLVTLDFIKLHVSLQQHDLNSLKGICHQGKKNIIFKGVKRLMHHCGLLKPHAVSVFSINLNVMAFAYGA